MAEAFDDMHEQIENNRIDNPDLKSRLRDQIAVPLRQLGESRMPELESQLQLVRADDRRGPDGDRPALAGRSSWPTRSWSRCSKCSTACWSWNRTMKWWPCSAASSTIRQELNRKDQRAADREAEGACLRIDACDRITG